MRQAIDQDVEQFYENQCLVVVAGEHCPIFIIGCECGSQYEYCVSRQSPHIPNEFRKLREICGRDLVNEERTDVQKFSSRKKTFARMLIGHAPLFRAAEKVPVTKSHEN
jgi:hypothetical protein